MDICEKVAYIKGLAEGLSLERAKFLPLLSMF